MGEITITVLKKDQDESSVSVARTMPVQNLGNGGSDGKTAQGSYREPTSCRSAKGQDPPDRA